MSETKVNLDDSRSFRSKMINIFLWLLAVLISVGTVATVPAREPAAADHDSAAAVAFSVTGQTAAQFGVHELQWRVAADVQRPLDAVIRVRFAAPAHQSGGEAAEPLSVWAFYDGDQTWRARVYVDRPGVWQWTIEVPDQKKQAAFSDLQRQSGAFLVVSSDLPGRLLRHPKNQRQWITENGQWFLNLSDTAYFLLCAQDGNGDPVSDWTAQQYVAPDQDRWTPVLVRESPRAGKHVSRFTTYLTVIQQQFKRDAVSLIAYQGHLFASAAKSVDAGAFPRSSAKEGYEFGTASSLPRRNLPQTMRRWPN